MGTSLRMTWGYHTSSGLRGLAGKCRDGAQVRRLLAMAMVLDGHPRSEAASSNGMDRQTLRDWVHRYNRDLRHFLAWHQTVQDSVFAIEGLAEYELIAYRQHMVTAGRRPATVNRRLDALRRLCRWAQGTGVLAADAARDVRPMRMVRNQQPAGLTDIEVHALLRSAGASSHGLAARNYAIV